MAVILGGALAFSMMPAAALAAPGDEPGTTGTTAVQWEIDSSQLSISVPTTIHTIAKADGTLQGPTNAKFVNDSIFNVYGTHYVTAETGTVKLVDAVTGENQFALTVNNGDKAYVMGPAEEHALYGADMELAKSTEYPLTAAGNVNADPVATPTSVFTVEWHFSTTMPDVKKEITYTTMNAVPESFKSAKNVTFTYQNDPALGVTSEGQDISTAQDESVMLYHDGDDVNVVTSDEWKYVDISANAANMFQNNDNLVTVDLGNAYADAGNFNYMFDGDRSLQVIDDVANLNTATAKSATCMFRDCDNLQSMDALKSADWGAVKTDTNGMFLTTEDYPVLNANEFANLIDTMELYVDGGTTMQNVVVQLSFSYSTLNNYNIDNFTMGDFKVKLQKTFATAYNSGPRSNTYTIYVFPADSAYKRVMLGDDMKVYMDKIAEHFGARATTQYSRYSAGDYVKPNHQLDLTNARMDKITHLYMNFGGLQPLIKLPSYLNIDSVTNLSECFNYGNVDKNKYNAKSTYYESDEAISTLMNNIKWENITNVDNFSKAPYGGICAGTCYLSSSKLTMECMNAIPYASINADLSKMFYTSSSVSKSTYKAQANSYGLPTWWANQYL